MADERGEGAGEGFTLNVPLRPGGDDHTYRRVFEERILPAVRAYRPELVLVSAGFDAHLADPLANMRVTETGFAWMAGAVADLADDMSDGRLVAVLEGGYDRDALSRSVAATLRAFDGERLQTVP
jgi:acetoin utilization deacetylase AcuC-like enzyme